MDTATWWGQKDPNKLGANAPAPMTGVGTPGAAGAAPWQTSAEKYLGTLTPAQWQAGNEAAIADPSFGGTKESGVYKFDVPGVGNVWDFGGTYSQTTGTGGANYINPNIGSDDFASSVNPRGGSGLDVPVQNYLSMNSPKAGGDAKVTSPTGGFNLNTDIVQPALVGVGGPLLGMAGAAYGLGGAGAAEGAGAGLGAAEVGYGGLAAVPGGLEIPVGTTAGGLSAGGGVAAGAGAGEAAMAGVGGFEGAGATAVPVGTAENAYAGLTAQQAANVAGASAYTAPSTGFADALTAEQAANVAAAGAGAEGGGGAAAGGAEGIMGSIGSGAKSLLSSKLALPIAATVGSMLLGNKSVEGTQNLKNESALQGSALANANSAQAGNITPAQQAQIDKWQGDQISQASQYLTNAGMGGIHKDPKTGQLTADSSAGLDMLGKIQQGSIALKQGFADQLFSQSMQQLGVSDAATENLIKLRLQQQQQTGQALSSFLLAYGMLGGWGAA